MIREAAPVAVHVRGIRLGTGKDRSGPVTMGRQVTCSRQISNRRARCRTTAGGLMRTIGDSAANGVAMAHKLLGLAAKSFDG